MPSDVSFRLLGPLEVIHHGAVVPINAARHRAVLALLLLSANRHVSRDVLIDRVWNGAPPDGAVKTLQSYLSRLRAALGDTDGARITAELGGRAYRLTVPTDRIDAVVFADLVSEGQAAFDDGDFERADAAFKRALGLWRDRPLADLAAEYRFVADAARRLESLRADAVEGALRVAAELGPLAALADDLDDAVRRHPDRAALRPLHLRALYAAGRIDDALAAYEAYRRDRGNRGFDPEPAVEELHRRILRQDPALADPRAPTPGFVGRAAHLARLRAAYAAVAAGRGRCVVIHGEAGIGKTALAARAVEEALAAGARVVYGSPHDPTGPAAYGPWLQILDALGPAGAAATAALTGDRGQPDERDRRYATVAAALRASAEDRPLVVYVDDLHEADAGSVGLVFHLARLVAGTRVLLLAVAREESPAVHQLRRLPGVESLRLPPLDDGEVGQLVGYELGRAVPPDLVTAVVTRAHGNPLYAVELTRLLADERALARLRDTGRLPGLPPMVCGAVRRRADLLPPDGRELLSFAAVLGVEFELAVLRAGAPEPVDQPLQAVIEAHFVEEVRTGILRFRHPLVRDLVYEALSRHDREVLHARAAGAIELAHAADLAPHAERLAQHWAQVSAADARPRAFRYTVLASRQAAAMLAWEDAARLLTRARELDDRPELLVELGDLYVKAGDGARAGRLFLDALAVPDLFVRAVLAIVEAGTYLVVGPGADHAIVLVGEALTRVGPAEPALRSRLLAGLAEVMVWASDGQSAANQRSRDAHSRAAVEVARRCGDPAVLARALRARLNATWRPDNAADRLDGCTELIGLAESRADAGLAVEGRRERFVAALELGRPDLLRSDVEAVALAAGETRRADRLFWAAVLAGTHAMLIGDFATAETAIGRTLRHSSGPDNRSVANQHGGVTAQILLFHRETGRLPAGIGQDAADLERLLLSTIHHNPTLDRAWQLGSASFLASRGRDAEARHLFAEAGFDTGPSIYPLMVAADLCARFADETAAATLYPLLAPYDGHGVVLQCGYGYLGDVALALGQLAGVLGRWDDAERHFTAALATHRRLGAAPLVARTRLEHARVLIRAGDPTERDRTRALLSSASLTGARFHLTPLVSEPDRLLAGV
jgi:DNA-binding SARP family transcriptional activator